MLMKLTFLLLFFSYLSQCFAYDVPSECKEIKVKDCSVCTVTTATSPESNVKKISDSMNVLASFSFIESEVEKLSKVNNTLKKNLAPLFRTLRDGEKEPTFKESRSRIAEIKKDFEKLTVLSREGLRLQKKFDICITSCSASRKLEISDEISRIQKMKIALFMGQPLLGNKAFEERMNSMDEKMISEDSFFSNDFFEHDLKEALFANINKLADRDTEFFHFQNDGKKPYRPEANQDYVKSYIDDASSRFPGIMEDLVKSSYYEGAYSDPATKHSACLFSKQFKTYSDRKEYKEMAVDAGLFILPLMTGPIGRGGALGVELMFGERLALWGLRSEEARKTINAASLVFQAGAVASDLERLQALSEECKLSEVRFLNKSSEDQLQEFRGCQKKLSDKIFMTELSLIPAATTNISAAALKYFNKAAVAKRPLAAVFRQEVKNADEMARKIQMNGLKLEKNQVGLEFKTADSGVFSVMDLNAVSKSTDASVKKIPEEYWRYVGNIYNERLNLSPAEVEGFIKSSVEMSPRTKLILNTAKSPLDGEMKINGGVGIVEAAKKGELLPLEKATGVRIDRKPEEKIVEIVRLTVGKDVEAEKMSKALVGNAVSLITQDKSISRVFIFTSKIHARLYKRMGIPADKIKDIDKRDVLIEMTRSELERVMKEKSILENAGAYLPALLKISSMMANIWSGGSTPSILTPLMR